MPEAATLKRARKAKRAERHHRRKRAAFVREEIHHIREGKHGARSAKQAIAIGLSKARRAGVKLAKPPAQRQGDNQAQRSSGGSRRETSAKAIAQTIARVASEAEA